MPASFGPSGLIIPTRQQIVDQIVNGSDGYPGLKQIYGADINIDPNSPDGQMVNIYAQAAVDAYEALAAAVASFDPDQAIGTALDRDCAYNGVVRQAGTQTIQNVLVTVAQGLTVPGLDTNPNGGAFTVQDGTGNQYQLVAAHTFGGAGAASLAFQAIQIGAVQSPLNSITIVVTTQVGITSVNNPTAPTTLGINEETDAALRIRRADSVELPSRGYLAGLLGALEDIPGVTAVSVIQNNTNATVGGVPSHSIWVIVTAPNTSPMQTSVGYAIYNKLNAGCGMKGAVSVNIFNPDFSIFVAKFDFSITQALWFACTVTAITGVVDKPYIAAQVLSKFGNAYGIGQSADATAIVAFIKSIAPNASVTLEGVSTDGVTYSAIVAPTDVQHQFNIPDAAHVVIS